LAKKTSKLPKNPAKGQIETIEVNSKNGKRNVTFEATGKEKFGKWKIIKNEAAGKFERKKINAAQAQQASSKRSPRAIKQDRKRAAKQITDERYLNNPDRFDYGKSGV
jgi:hypothetical protein